MSHPTTNLPAVDDARRSSPRPSAAKKQTASAMREDEQSKNRQAHLGAGITPGRHREDPRPAAVTFVTTEHFTLQGARAATIAESTGRATIFLGAVSGGLVALGLIATASRVGTAFYTFGLVLLPTLAFAGLVTFQRVLQSGIEDLGYARRIALLRGFYFDAAPELTPYLMSVPEPERLNALGLWAGRRQYFRTVAGMVAVITAVLAGSGTGLLAAVASDDALNTALLAGGVAAVTALTALMRCQQTGWERAAAAPLSDAHDTEPRRHERRASPLADR